jgi:beta-mannosidase
MKEIRKLKHQAWLMVTFLFFLIPYTWSQQEDEKIIKDDQLNKKISLSWEVGYHEQINLLPDKWFPAVVPGAVQLDLLKTLDNPDWQFADGYKQFQWMEDVYWTYRCNFNKPSLTEDQHLFCISKGIDYRFNIFLNGNKLVEQEGMFTPVETDITSYLQENNELIVMISPVPKSNQRRMDRSQANHSFKPAVSYGWDWHPRLVPSGIWDETYLEIRDPFFLKDIQYQYQLDENLKTAKIWIGGKTTDYQGSAIFTIRYNNQIILKKETDIINGEFSIAENLDEINLWWPCELGKQDLYEFHLYLLNTKGETTDYHTWRSGFRKIRLVENRGAEVPGTLFPKTRNNPPFTLEINNIRIFAKGTNWVNPEIFPGIITADRYKELLDLAKGMHFNLLRVWGGGIINKDVFFELCDEMGIMIWQEFPLACNKYPNDPAYLEVLKQEATSIVKRIHNHPSLAIWSGGNELFNSWSGMTDQSLPLRWLNTICLEYSPEIPFIPTSPVMGVGHGHYIFYDKNTDEDVFQIMNRSHYTALTEFGMPSPSDPEIIKKIIPWGELFPPAPTDAWKAHHAYGAWIGDTWLCPDILEKYFGKAESLEELVQQGQMLQSIGYKAIYEHARQQWPYCSMALNWCFNEPWPTAANNSIIQYPSQPKPCYEAIKQACRPALASASIPKFCWKKNEDLKIGLFMINGTQDQLPPGKMEVSINGNLTETWEYPEVRANRNLPGPTIIFPLSGITNKWIKVELKILNQPELNSEYLLKIN